MSDRKCDTCCHYAVETEESPCMECYAYDQWEVHPLSRILRDALVEVGTNLMKSIREEFPPKDYPSTADIDEMSEQAGMYFNDDLLIHTAVYNAQKIAEVLEELE